MPRGPKPRDITLSEVIRVDPETKEALEELSWVFKVKHHGEVVEKLLDFYKSKSRSFLPRFVAMNSRIKSDAYEPCRA